MKVMCVVETPNGQMVFSMNPIDFINLSSSFNPPGEHVLYNKLSSILQPYWRDQMWNLIIAGHSWMQHLREGGVV